MQEKSETQKINEFLLEIDRLFSPESVEKLARQSGFVERQSPLTGHLFLTVFVFGVSVYQAPTLEQ